MLERLNDLPPGVDGVKASGDVSAADYEQVLEPMLDAARREGRRLRFLYYFSPEFRGLSPGAAWQDTKIGLRSLRLFDGCAIATDVGWIREAARLAAFMMPCPVKVFDTQGRNEAVRWLASLPEGPAISYRLIPDVGVLVAEIDRPLRAQDFDALSVTADSWIEAHGRLHGLVIHARAFPGWENLSALFRHIRFVRDHHRKIQRIALAVDGKLASLAPHLAEHFVKAEVKTFAYDALDQAILFAGHG